MAKPKLLAVSLTHSIFAVVNDHAAPNGPSPHGLLALTRQKYVVNAVPVLVEL